LSFGIWKMIKPYKTSIRGTTSFFSAAESKEEKPKKEGVLTSKILAHQSISYEGEATGSV